MVNQEIANGSIRLLKLAKKTSKRELPLAVAQLLLTAAALCETEETFREAVEATIHDVF